MLIWEVTKGTEILQNDEGGKRFLFFVFFFKWTTRLKIFLVVRGSQEDTGLELLSEEGLSHELHFLLKD